MITSEQVRAARALLRWDQRQLAEASGVSLPSIKRLETKFGLLAAHERTSDAIRRTLEAAGVDFLSETGGGAGVRLRGPYGAACPEDSSVTSSSSLFAAEGHRAKQR